MSSLRSFISIEVYLIGDILPARQYVLKQPQKKSRQVFTESRAKPLGLVRPHFFQAELKYIKSMVGLLIQLIYYGKNYIRNYLSNQDGGVR